MIMSYASGTTAAQVPTRAREAPRDDVRGVPAVGTQREKPGTARSIHTDNAPARAKAYGDRGSIVRLGAFFPITGARRPFGKSPPAREEFTG
jgi:hypothetical protein